MVTGRIGARVLAELEWQVVGVVVVVEQVDALVFVGLVDARPHVVTIEALADAFLPLGYEHVGNVDAFIAEEDLWVHQFDVKL